MNGACDRDRARVGRRVIEDGRRQTVYALQDLVWRRRPASGLHFGYRALKRRRRADRMRGPRLARLGKTLLKKRRGTKCEGDFAVRARMQIQDSARLRSEIDQRSALQNLQNDDLAFHERRQGRGLSGLVAQSRQVVARHGQDVEPLPQPLAKDEQLDARRVARRRGILMDKAVLYERCEMTIHRRLRCFELTREVRHADRVSRARQPLQQAQR